MSACAVAKCKCVEFKAQKWISLKCHTCYHWESEHTLNSPRLSINPDLGEALTPRTSHLSFSRSASPSSNSPMSPHHSGMFLSPRKPPPSPPSRRAPPPPMMSQSFPASRKQKEDEELKLFVIPNSPQGSVQKIEVSDDSLSVRANFPSEDPMSKGVRTQVDDSSGRQSDDSRTSMRSPRPLKAAFRNPSLDDPSINLPRGPTAFPSKTRRGGFIDLEHEALMPSGSTPRFSQSASVSSSPSKVWVEPEDLSRGSSELLSSLQFRQSWSQAPISLEESREPKRDTPPTSLSRLRRSSSVCNAVERRLSGIERRLSVVEQMLESTEPRKSVQDMVSDALLIIKQHDGDLSPAQTSALEHMVRSGSLTRVQRAMSVLETKSSQDAVEESNSMMQRSRSKSKQEPSPRASVSTYGRKSFSKSPKQAVDSVISVNAAYTPINDRVQEREEPLLRTLAIGTDPVRSAVLLDRFVPKRILGSGANGCAIMVFKKDESVRYAAKFIPLFASASDMDPNRVFMEPAYSEALISCLVTGLPHFITCEEVFTVDYATLSAWFGTMRATTLSRNEKHNESEAKQAQLTFLNRFRGSKAKSYMVVVQELCQMTLDHFLVLHRRGLNEVPPVNEHFSLSLPPPSPDEMRYIMFAVTYALLVGKLTLGLLWNDLANRNILLQPLEGEPQESYTYHVKDSYDGFEEVFIVPGSCLPQVNGYYFEVKLVDFGVAEAHGGSRYSRRDKRCYRSMTDKRVMKVAGGLEDKDLIDLEGTLMRTLHNDHLKDVPNELLSDRVPKHKKTGWLEHQTKTEAAAAANHDWYLSILKGRPAIQTLKRALKHKFYRPFRQKLASAKQAPPPPMTPKTPHTTTHSSFEPSSKSRSSSNLFSFHTSSSSSSSSSCSASSTAGTGAVASASAGNGSPSLPLAPLSSSGINSRVPVSPSVPGTPSSANTSFSSRSKPSRPPQISDEPCYEISLPNSTRSRARPASLSGTLTSRPKLPGSVVFDFQVET